MKESKTVKEFSRFAHQYNKYSMIQSAIAEILIGEIPNKEYHTIIDIGCGSGLVYKNMKKHQFHFEHFIAIDSSKEMLALHPGDKRVEKYQLDFDDIESYLDLFCRKENTLIVSSSALQWSKNIERLIRDLSRLANQAYFAVFTSNTFKTLHHMANINSPIYSEERLKEVFREHYCANFQLYSFQLEFQTTREMFQYIKKSGVSGGKKYLGYKETKTLMSAYPLKYLEFEILLMEGTSLA